MWKLRNKKGFTLVEVICSLAVFTIIFTFSSALYLSSVKAKLYINEIDVSKKVLEGLRKELLFNTNRHDMKQMIESGRVYISCNAAVYENIKNRNVTELFTSDIPERDPYIEISEEEVNTISHMTLKLHISYYGKNKIIVSEFYKGEL